VIRLTRRRIIWLLSSSAAALALGLLSGGIGSSAPEACRVFVGPLLIAYAVGSVVDEERQYRRRLALDRSKQQLCPHCGYDCRASGAFCPECGSLTFVCTDQL
jgi:hypothetical protein